MSQSTQVGNVYESTTITIEVDKVERMLYFTSLICTITGLIASLLFSLRRFPHTLWGFTRSK